MAPLYPLLKPVIQWIKLIRITVQCFFMLSADIFQKGKVTTTE